MVRQYDVAPVVHCKNGWCLELGKGALPVIEAWSFPAVSSNDREKPGRRELGERKLGSVKSRVPSARTNMPFTLPSPGMLSVASVASRSPLRARLAAASPAAICPKKSHFLFRKGMGAADITPGKLALTGVSASVAESVTFPVDATKTRLQLQGEVSASTTIVVVAAAPKLMRGFDYPAK